MNVNGKILLASLAMSLVGNASASFVVDYGTDLTVDPRAIHQEIAAPKQRLLLDKSVEWLRVVGNCEHITTTNQSNGLPLKIAMANIIPKGWVAYNSIEDDIEHLPITWTRSQLWYEPFRIFAEANKIIIEIDCAKKTLEFKARPDTGKFSDTAVLPDNPNLPISLSLQEEPQTSIPTTEKAVDDQNANDLALAADNRSDEKPKQQPVAKSDVEILKDAGLIPQIYVTPDSNESFQAFINRYAAENGYSYVAYRTSTPLNPRLINFDVWKKVKTGSIWKLNRKSYFVYDLSYALKENGLLVTDGVDYRTDAKVMVITDNQQVANTKPYIFKIEEGWLSKAVIEVANAYGFRFPNDNRWNYDKDWPIEYSYHITAIDVLDALEQLLGAYPISAPLVKSTSTISIVSRINRN